MLMLVCLKVMADLALYFTFGGLFAVIYGARTCFVFAALLILSGGYVCSYGLRTKSGLRFLPLLAAVLFLGWYRELAAEGLVLLPPVFYLFYLVLKEIYEPDRYAQMGIFSWFWKLFFGFCVLMIVSGKLWAVTAVSIPMGVLMMAASVLIMRAMRHEPEIYLQKRYQWMNLLLVLGVVGAVLLLSSDLMITGVVTVIKLIYQWVVLPVIMLAVCIFAVIVWLGSKLLSFLHVKNPIENQQVQMQIMDVNQMFEGIVPGADHEALFARILAGIAITAAIVICILVFRALTKRDHLMMEGTKPQDSRSRMTVKREKTAQKTENTYAQKVREQYRGFLHMLELRGIMRTKSDTSLDVREQYRIMERDAKLDGKLATELRELYLAARYDGQAGKTEVQRAKEICEELKKISRGNENNSLRSIQ